MISIADPVESFIYHWKPYAHQAAFHKSPAPHRLLGGAAGPGKTLALIEDHMLHCNRFSAQDAAEVHTLIVRRTYPKLEDTVITRFREKIPHELYRDYNESKHIVTWLNGSTTKFAAMQHEHDVWGFQGQWYKIGYDELTEFTYPQWQNISAWNRCPVANHCTKDGATNPIGIGAGWVENLFVKKKPCKEMDKGQAALYNRADYEYFAATYLQNPVYASDPNYVRNLDSYPLAVSNALKMGVWGVSGGYFEDAWDEGYNVFEPEQFAMKPYFLKWLGGDWGFDHNSAIYWLCQDDSGIVRIYRELVINRQTPEMLAERIVELSERDGFEKQGGAWNPPNYQLFSFSHDAFAERHDVNPIGVRIGRVLQKAGLVAPAPSTKDKIGREQILYDYLKARVKVGEVYNDVEGKTEPVYEAKLQISSHCEQLIDAIVHAPRDERNTEEIAEFLGDDPLQGAGYGLYAMFGGPNRKPTHVQIEEQIQEWKQRGNLSDPTQEMMWRKTLELRAQKNRQPKRFAYRGLHRS